MDYVKELLHLLRFFISLISTSLVALVAWAFINFDSLSVVRFVMCVGTGGLCMVIIAALVWLYIKQAQTLKE